MKKEKAMRIELSYFHPLYQKYYYAELELPSKEYEIWDVLQKLRVRGIKEPGIEIAVLECPALPNLAQVRLDSPTEPEMECLAERLAILNSQQKALYQAMTRHILKVGEDELVSMKDLINVTYNLNKGQNEWMEVYDGTNLPARAAGKRFVFGLEIAGTPQEDEDEVTDNSEWMTLPISKGKADAIAKQHGESCIEDCVYLEFESTIPQITEEVFDSMENFEKYNMLAARISLMTLEDICKFKAVLSAETPTEIDEILDITENLCAYELSPISNDKDDFLKEYLDKYLDVRFDREWIRTLSTGSASDELIQKLGAAVTEYGVVSARGRSLYELVPYRETEEFIGEESEGQEGGMVL